MMSLRIEQASFSYNRSQPVLRDVSVECTPGQVVGIFGPNGSGKSTLLRCLNGALQPQSGTVWLDDHAMGHMSPRQIATHIAVVPQDTALDVPFTVGEIVALGRYPHHTWSTDRQHNRHIITASLERAGVGHLSDRPFAQLSGGERQRVVIARALAQLGTYLLLDEPASHLDITHQLDLYHLLRQIAAEGVGVVMICHDLFLAPMFVDRAILLTNGAVHRVGVPSDVLRPEAISQVYQAPIELSWVAQQACTIRVGTLT